MGTCGSRDKELKEKLGLSDKEFDRCVKVFNKMSEVPPG
jgi:hypothetical protein